MSPQDLVLLLAVIIAAGVETVEAVSIVVALGVTRSWRSSLQGAAAAIVVLAALVAVTGPTLVRVIPIDKLRMVIGGLALLLGMQWARQSILRSAHIQAMRDEAAIFRDTVAAAEAAPKSTGFDTYAFVVSFKGVFIEGLEVVFIVMTIGLSTGKWALAGGGAAFAVLLVGAIGAAAARPLSRVPENLMKMAVAILLMTFGTIWLGKGAGIVWPAYQHLPGDATFVPVFLVFYFVLTQVLVRLARQGTSPARTIPEMRRTP